MPDVLSASEDRRLFRTVTAMGAELRKQGAVGSAGEAKVDLIELTYAAMAAARGEDQSDGSETRALSRP
jgi:hypothetical protein